MPVFRKYDPIPAFTFHVSIEGMGELGYFTECEGITFERNIVEHKEGGVNDMVYMFPGQVKQGTVRLKRGVDYDFRLLDWYLEGSINGKMPRNHVSILIFNRAHEQVARFDLLEAFPTEYSGPALKADDIAPAVEILSITHGGQNEEGGGGEGGEGDEAEGEDDEAAGQPPVDVPALAKKVYALMMHEARLERERQGHR